MNRVIDFLQKHHINYILHEHPPVFTCEEADEHCGDIPGLACKNLFLSNKKRNRFFLLVMPADKKTDLKKLGEIVGEKITFAKPEHLKEKLNLEPGSVSPFGLIHDHKQEVELYVDRNVCDANIVSFHPNVNTATLELSKDMFQSFLDILDHHAHIVTL